MGGAFSVWLLNRTSEKDVYINVVCRKMSLPVGISIRLDELATAHLTAYKGELGRIDTLRIKTDEQTLPFSDQKKITFIEKPAEASGALSPPSFVIQPQPSYGEMKITVGPGAELRVPENSTINPTLEVESIQADDTILELSMDMVNVEANRVVIQELKGIRGLEGDDYYLTASNKTALTWAKFGSLRPSDNGSHALASISFNRPKEIALLSAETTAVAVRGRLNFSACPDPEIKIGGDDPSKEIKGSPLDLKLQGKAIVLNEIIIEPLPEKAGKYALRIKARGTAQSVMQDNRELISTRLEDILNKPAAEKGLYGLGALLCIFAGSVFLKRALDVLAKTLIPSEQTKDGGKDHDAFD